MVCISTGSSPLTRGKRGPCGWPARPARLIPAHAGKTAKVNVSHFTYPAHPRSRGENLQALDTPERTWGSSPLTRGKPLEGLAGLLSGRLIPAHAGKTPAIAGDAPWLQAHPRSRGENVVVCLPPSDTAGSSPLTRGKHVRRIRPCLLRGLIPAHAGKTMRPPCLIGRGAAHPRSRGENTRVMRAGWVSPGSSPLTRGKPGLRLQPHHAGRLIPAHAGKTYEGDVEPGFSVAHPRSRGENLAWAVEGARAYGSSPLTRGKRSVREDERTMTGLIPAHAGKTLHVPPARSWCPAHPRSRGENAGDVLRDDCDVGSSPLTRGKQSS